MDYDAIYLSPHLDDAALSCGGQIHRAVREGQHVLIVTLFAGRPDPDQLSPLAQQIHQLWPVGGDLGVIATRRLEDEAACQRLGADWRHEELPDALYRRLPSGEQRCQQAADLFSAPSDADQDTLQRLEQALASLPASPRVVAPLAIGGHLDHRLTRLAAEGARGVSLELYEDIPYAFSWRKRWRVLNPPWRWRHRSITLTTTDLDAKVDALRCYPSQMGTVFADDKDLRDRIVHFAQRRGGERLWSQR